MTALEEGCRIYRCAVMGQHPMRFPWGFDEEDDRCQKLKMELAQQIMVLRQRGVTQFLTACDCGVGLYAAEIVNGLRETADQDLMLFCYTPHEEQATKWAPYLRGIYSGCALINKRLAVRPHLRGKILRLTQKCSGLNRVPTYIASSTPRKCSSRFIVRPHHCRHIRKAGQQL